MSQPSQEQQEARCKSERETEASKTEGVKPFDGFFWGGGGVKLIIEMTTFCY